MTDADIQAVAELAAELAAAAGLGAPRQVQVLPGGRNNRVYRVACADDQDAVLKCYHHDPRDPRDRLGAEWQFLNYVGARGVRNVPAPLVADPSRHAALYGFVPGERPADAGPNLLLQAAAFVAAINGAPVELDRLAPASEACFSVQDHLTTIDRRVARLNDIDRDVPHAAQARSFVQQRLAPAWTALRADISERCEAGGVKPDQPVRQIVSPSDFGFHNALVSAGGNVGFLDFEYAGRDDPAKLICDFFCQPQIPPPPDQYERFKASLAASLDLDADDQWRTDLLLDAYRIKWTCIMLNEFSAVGARRRAFASADDVGSRAAHQLAAAERYLARVKI